ncbi:DNA/RNA nuclease SfsA [Acetivibrio clariflavus]|uniref:Sugar fermentation stimulation protein homolog n=1 Tax=Acetivibrio clariflavus (strain DSM 19732 / NBRC 101661 / EBR45) TaxID=720554 RepID=G8LTF8_ACECE|nr:DNA/RNA nuclease SfsA [Acetivibrio clariflavus]AEV69453.1 sugar fermentation stimulation protein [Acetivibrio clariflavus DSM 19732]HOQ01788.1 DNA/RNA nuclease SfsA [Acetivibrio clariflavus]
MKIEGELVKGRFVERLNRFEAVVEIEGSRELVHVPNTGRLKELLTKKAAVLVRKFDNPNRKTKFGLLFVKKGGVWVSIDSANLPNRIVYDALKSNTFEQFAAYSEIRREVTLLNSRFDFGLFNGEQEYYIEVKGVTLVEDRQAFFPDAPTTRGTRHLEELVNIKLSGKGAGVIFIVQREDADEIRPNDRTDKGFGIALRNAKKAGVDLFAYVCKIDIDQKQVNIIKSIPVVLD